MNVTSPFEPSRLLNTEHLVTLLQTTDNDWFELREEADRVRKSILGPEVHLRGIIEFSNFCTQNCLYCGLRRDNHLLQRYRLDPAEILAIARKASALGFQTIVLQSGEDPWFTVEDLSRLVFQVKSLHVTVTLSLGERKKVEYRSWREAGADRYLLKHETSDETLFARMRPGTTLKNRLHCLHALRDLDYEVGAGVIIGLPGQNLTTLAHDLLLLRDLEVEMAGNGPFIPNPLTPLANFPPGSLDLTLRFLALARLLLPQTHLPATTAIHTLHPQGRRMALQAGANVIMPNVTPEKYRAAYQIYPKDYRHPLEQQLQDIRQTLADLGRHLTDGLIMRTPNPGGHPPQTNS